MKYELRRIWNDIKLGRNLELYSSILAALVIGIMSLFSDIPWVEKNVMPTTLIVLSLIAFGLLQDRRKSELPLHISADNTANADYICRYIMSHKVTRARLIQFSGDMMRRVVDTLLERGATVELLLQHPGEAPNEVQIEKMAAFRHRVKHDLKNTHNLIIRYYKESASVRGVKLDDNLLSMGWYTYRNKSRLEHIPWLYGHNNASVNVHLEGAHARDLEATFDETFQTLWENSEPHSDSIDAVINQRLRKITKTKKP